MTTQHELPEKMTVMRLEQPGQLLQQRMVPLPRPGPGQLLIKVTACGVCRTDLHLVDGELPPVPLPVVPGHEIVGRVVAGGEGTEGVAIGERVGVPWLGWTCGTCPYCTGGHENLCDNGRFTGYTIAGGFAEYTVADQRYCFALPSGFDDVAAAPLLCAGLIGYRSYRLCGDRVAHLGIYGFGAAAHIITQVAVHQGQQVYAFTRPGDDEAQAFALKLGAVWAGDSLQAPPRLLDAAIIFAPVGSLVPAALRAVHKGGVVVCGGIHMSEIPAFPYRILWQERQLRSVANLERRDGEELLQLAAEVPVTTEVQRFTLAQANEALDRLRDGRLQGAAVLSMTALERYPFPVTSASSRR